MTLKTPWTLIDPTDDGSGILARIVTDREMGHVAVFESPETARAVVELINRAESAEQERRELERELAETRAKLESAKRDAELAHAAAQEQHGSCFAQIESWKSMACTPAERAVLDAAHAYANREHERNVFELEGDMRAAAMKLARRGENPFAGVRASDWLRELREEDGEKS